MEKEYWICPNCFSQNKADEMKCAVCRHDTVIKPRKSPKPEKEKKEKKKRQPGNGNVLRVFAWLLRLISLALIGYYCYQLFIAFQNNVQSADDLFRTAGNLISRLFSGQGIDLQPFAAKFETLNLDSIQPYLEYVFMHFTRFADPYRSIQMFSALIILIWTVRVFIRKGVCSRRGQGSILPLLFELFIMGFFLTLVLMVANYYRFSATPSELFGFCQYYFTSYAVFALIGLLIVSIWFVFRRIFTHKGLERREITGIIVSILFQAVLVYTFC